MNEPNVKSELLLDLAIRHGEYPFLVLGGEAALANALAGDVTFAPTDLREAEAAGVQILRELIADSFQTVLLPAPPNRDLLRRQLLNAANALARDGLLMICGANVEGGKSAIKDAESLLGKPMWSSYRQKHRMGMFRKTDLLAPPWSDEPGIAPGTWQAFTVATPAGDLTLETQAGVFAGAKLDAGTRLLLEHLDVAPGARVLDIGCGVGVIGIVAAKRGASEVILTDANLLAVEAASRNLTTHDVIGRAIASDVYSHLGHERFDLIVSNPPFHRGKNVDLSVANRIIEESSNHLRPGGSLLLVANVFLAYSMNIATVFDRVERVAATPQYHVLRGETT